MNFVQMSRSVSGFLFIRLEFEAGTPQAQGILSGGRRNRHPGLALCQNTRALDLGTTYPIKLRIFGCWPDGADAEQSNVGIGARGARIP